MQFDADEDGEPFFKPPIISTATSGGQDESQIAKQHPPEPDTGESATSQSSAAITTVEQDE